MEQRRLRPGDRLDDYCPRERRLTDHVIVAVVDDTIKQTRCVACDTEHPYKDGKVPLRRKKKEEDAPILVERVIEPPVEEEMAQDDAPIADPQPNLVLRPERKPGKGKRAAVAAAPAPLPPAVAPLPPPSSAE